jgi:hypothetical protein
MENGWGGYEYEHVFVDTDKSTLQHFKQFTEYDIDLTTMTGDGDWFCLEENLQQFGILYPYASITIVTLYGSSIVSAKTLQRGVVTVKVSR